MISASSKKTACVKQTKISSTLLPKLLVLLRRLTPQITSKVTKYSQNTKTRRCRIIKPVAKAEKV